MHGQPIINFLLLPSRGRATYNRITFCMDIPCLSIQMGLLLHKPDIAKRLYFMRSVGVSKEDSVPVCYISTRVSNSLRLFADLNVAHKIRNELPLFAARRKDVYEKYDGI